jgi:hypothetical protein
VGHERFPALRPGLISVQCDRISAIVL